MSVKPNFPADDQDLPPYSESVTSPPSLQPDNKTLPRPSLHAQLTSTRTRRIQHLLTTHIEPELSTQFLDGVSKCSFLLIPSDLLTHHPHLTANQLVGLSATSHNPASVIRLHGDENRAAFWHQSAVLQELTSSLRARLAASGHQLQPPITAVNDTPVETVKGLGSLPPGQAEPAPRQTSPSWFRKQYRTPGPLHDPTATTNYRLGWRSEEEDLPKRSLGSGEVRVRVEARDVSFRVETEMGLLDSVTGKVLWVELEVGA